VIRVGKQNAGVWAGVVVLIFSSIIFWQSLSLKYTTNFGPGPGMFPRWLTAILIILSLIYIWQSIKKEVFRIAEVFPKGKDLGNVFSVLISVVVFMVIVNFTGFVIASTVLLFIVLRREFKWHIGLAISLFTSIVLFLLFKAFFNIPLPVNVLGW
jgi:putative tricarboxylic transport membrane protein